MTLSPTSVKKNSNTTGRIALCAGGLFFLFTFSLYAYNFWSSQVSSSPGDWGVFGDFMGGVVNPLLGLVTIWLITKNLQQNSVILTQTQEQMELTRDEIERAVKAQIETKQALDFQNELASAEKDFNAMVTTISMFNERIEKAQTDLKVELAREDSSNPDRLNIIKNFICGSKRKREALEDLLEKEYDKLLDRVVYSSGDRFSAAKLWSNSGYSYQVTYESNTNIVHCKVFKNGIGNNYHFTVEGAPEEKLLPRRFDSITNAMFEAQGMIEYHIKHGIWPGQEKANENNTGKRITIKIPSMIPYKDRRS